MKHVYRFTIVLALVALGWVLYARLTFDREGWLADYAALKNHLGVAYANLDWMRERREVDTRALDRRTTAALEAAHSDRAARKAIEAFVRAFDDPHLRVERQPPAWWTRLSGLWKSEEVAAAITAGASGADACAAQGYDSSGTDFGLDVAALPEWRGTAEGAFPAGSFGLPGGRRAGLVRIAEFGEQKYADACVAAWEAAPREAPCDEECQYAFRSAVLDTLTGRVAGVVAGLGDVDVLVVDLTGNGGGSEWVNQVAGILTDRPLRAPPVGFVKHAHWTDRLEESAARIAADLADPETPAGARETLAEALRRLEAALAAAREPCDRAFLWTDGERLPECPQTVVGKLYGSGPMDWLPAGSLAGIPSRDDVYARAEVREPAWRGPLWVLVDGGTASAAEELPAVLADNGAARIVGEPTYGAGCGYTDGGLPLELPHSHLVLWLPDCARYRRDGTNEVEGVTPDVPLAWSRLDGPGRSRALVEVIAAE